ncbi:hypothetical protein COOONC_10977 [Cooperia oncophora]
MYRKVNDHVLICLLYEYKLGRSTRTAHENLIRAFGQGAIADGTVVKWYTRFRRGRQTFYKRGNPGGSRVLDDDELERTVKANPKMSISKLAKKFGVGMTTVWKHLKRISNGQKMAFIGPKINDKVSFRVFES